MKLIVVLLAVLAMGAKAQDEASKELLRKCAKENGITAEIFAKEEKGDDASQALKCTLACMYKEFFNEDGKLNMTKITDKFEKNEKVLSVIYRCAETLPKSDDKCKTAFDMHQCVKKSIANDKN